MCQHVVNFSKNRALIGHIEEIVRRLALTHFDIRFVLRAQQ